MTDRRTSLLDRIGRSWRSAGRDIVLIVVSITIAFAVDAWWDGRGDRQRERAHLVALSEEFRALRLEMQKDLRGVQRASAAASRLLQIVQAGPGEAGADTVASLLNRTFDVGVLPRDGGALLTLLASGDVRLLRDEELARLLMEWPGLVQDLRSDGELLTFNREQELRPRLSALGLSEARIASNLPWWELEPALPFDPRRLAGDVTLESALVSRLVRLRLLEEQLGGALNRLDTIAARLEGSR